MPAHCNDNANSRKQLLLFFARFRGAGCAVGATLTGERCRYVTFDIYLISESSVLP